MRRKVIICVLLFINIILFRTQIRVDNIGFQNKNILPAPITAEAYSLSKVTKFPMDLFRGKANVSIPIYTIAVDGVNIPISLSYNTGGIKLNEVSSTVGLGWALNIPGIINKTIHGKDDSIVPFFNKDIDVYSSYNGFISHLLYDEERRNNLWHIFNGGYDLKPDLFNYNIPNLSGSFILKNNIGLPIPYEDIKIDYIHSFYINGKRFKISDNLGNTYWFSTKNISDFSDPTSAESLNITSVTYKIDSIATSSNQLIRFFYNKNFGYTERNFIEKVYVKTGIDYDPHNRYFNLPPKYEKWESQAGNTEQLITRIEFPSGSVEFNYSNDENGELAIENAAYRKDLNSVNGVALRRLVVKDLSNHVISDNKLNYGYFESNGSSNVYENYRLKLLNVQDVLSNTYHRFTYNEKYAFPPRNSYSDDYWGYVNTLVSSYSDSNIPLDLIYPISLPPHVYPRDRNVNPNLAQVGTLATIEYPTRGLKNLYYESPRSELVKDLGHIVDKSGMFKELLNVHSSEEVILLNTKSENYIYSDFDFPPNAIDPSLYYSFSNSCTNAGSQGPGNEHPYPGEDPITECIGTILFYHPDNNVNIPTVPQTSGGELFEGNYKGNMPVRVSINLNRMGRCGCSVSTELRWKEYVKSTDIITTYLPGLRVSKIEDINENSTTNIFNYKYGKYNTSNKFKEISVLKKPFNFTKIDKKIFRNFDDDGVERFPQRIQEFFTLMNSSQSSNTYSSSDAITYPFVIEENDLGKIYYEFEDTDYHNQSAISPNYENYNDWKNGLLLSTKYVNQLGDTIKSIKNEYQINSLKNGLSDFNTKLPDKLAFAANMNVIPGKIQLSPGLDIEGDIFYVDNEISFIESGKLENILTTTKEFYKDKILKTSILNDYYDADINKPINLKSQTTTFPDKSVSETTYQYAYEKSNQRLIEANMIGIPLETETRLNNNTISKTETKYDNPSLLLPTSVLSYDVRSKEMDTEVTYDKYDDKGNLLQYTTKDGISATIIWGYYQTQPIVKIEGVKYTDLDASTIQEIVNASNIDAGQAAGSDESTLLSALDTFRAQNTTYQITTYTYDPLVGVRSITPPSGIREYYYYDHANRLEQVRDVNGKILKEYKYNYKQ